MELYPVRRTSKNAPVLKNERITTLFLDIGGVLLTNGWDHNSRRKAIEQFRLDGEEVNERHHLTFDTYESGKITLDEYLNRVIFYEKRNFTKNKFRKFMFNESQRLGTTLEYFKELKKKHHLKVIAVSNEGRELNEHRIEKFQLGSLFDAFVSSCFVHFRKPDIDMYKMACDISHTLPSQALCIDDRYMFIQVARSVGIRGIHFRDIDSFKKQIEKVEF